MIELPNRYLDLRSDFGFKHVFAKEANKDILIAFLNALLPGKGITNVNLRPTEYKHHKDTSRIFFDLSFIGEHGEKFIIEMQKRSQFYFRDRSVYYMSCMIADQLQPGKTNTGYPLKEVYFIGILNFILNDSDKNEHTHKVSLSDNSSGNIFYNKMHYIFIEIPKFDNKENKLTKELDKWIFLFKNLHQLNALPEQLNQPVFRKIFTIAEISKLNKEERMLFDRNLKNQRDYEASIEYAAFQSREEGVDAGKKQGALLTAKKFLKNGIPLKEVARITGIPAEQLEAQ